MVFKQVGTADGLGEPFEDALAGRREGDPCAVSRPVKIAGCGIGERVARALREEADILCDGGNEKPEQRLVEADVDHLAPLRCHTDCPETNGPHDRSGSPPSGCSTLITSAPRSANIEVAVPQEIMMERSTTVRPVSGPTA